MGELQLCSDKLRYLRRTDILCDLEQDEIAALGKRAPTQRAPAGTIFRPGAGDWPAGRRAYHRLGGAAPAQPGGRH